MSIGRTAATIAVGLVLTACSGADAVTAPPATTSGPVTTTTGPMAALAASVPPSATSPPSTTTTTRAPTGTTIPTPSTTTTTTTWPVLELRADGHGVAVPTPPRLEDRRLPTPDHLPPPATEGFAATVGPVPDEVLARSSWHEGCPVAAEDLAYVTVSHHGFDGGQHTGELIVHASAADGIVDVFAALHAASFPLEEVRVLTAAELEAPPTGVGNVTSAFECRDVAGPSSSWSRHASGLAIDVNPFHNPYAKGDLVLPELASAYLDRTWERPGMIAADDVAVTAFAEMGWAWGGRWRSAKDWMHFSADGR